MPLGDGVLMVEEAATNASWVLRRRGCELRVWDFVVWFNGKFQRAQWGKLQVGVSQSGADRTGHKAFLCELTSLVSHVQAAACTCGVQQKPPQATGSSTAGCQKTAALRGPFFLRKHHGFRLPLATNNSSHAISSLRFTMSHDHII